MLKSGQLLLTFASIILLALSLWLIFQNVPVETPAGLWTENFRRISLAWPLALAAFTFGSAVLLAAWRWILSLESRRKRTGRELERREVSREEAENKVKVLERKIETLEKALSEALKR